MNQHWYHCHTCKMIEGVGVCSICAKVCHRGHDVTYAKFGNFFCDCGAKDNNFCQVKFMQVQLFIVITKYCSYNICLHLLKMF